MFNTIPLAFRTYHIVFHIISHIVYHIIYHIFHAYAGVVFHASSSFCMSIISYHSNYINISYHNASCFHTTIFIIYIYIYISYQNITHHNISYHKYVNLSHTSYHNIFHIISQYIVNTSWSYHSLTYHSINILIHITVISLHERILVISL